MWDRKPQEVFEQKSDIIQFFFFFNLLWLWLKTEGEGGIRDNKKELIQEGKIGTWLGGNSRRGKK